MKTKLPILLSVIVAFALLAGDSPRTQTPPPVIAFPGALHTWVYDANSRGQVVGCYYYEEGYNPETGYPYQHLNGFLYYKGEYTSIEVPGDKFTIPKGIKENGEVYGLYVDLEWSPDWEHSFTWRKGRFTLTP